jgi:hypothetical protein
MNQIYQRQQEEYFVRMLAAQRQLYSDEKRWTAIWAVVATAVAILGTGVFALQNTFTPYLTILFILVAVVELIAIPWIQKKRQLAAQIQEKFDCELLELPRDETLPGPPGPEVIMAAAKRYLKKPPTEQEMKGIRAWYTEQIKGLPLHTARIVCQKENLWWDSEQRRAYAHLLVGILVLLTVLLLILAIALNWTVVQFFSGPVLLFLPIYVAVAQNALAHLRAAKRLDELKEFSERLLQDARAPEPDITALTQGSRQLQTQIFEHRSSNPPVLDWIYRRYQPQMEDHANTPGHLLQK